jgi:hypothetical protein
MNKQIDTTERTDAVAGKIRKHLTLMFWILAPMALAAWERGPQADGTSEAFDFSRFKVAVPLAMLLLLYLLELAGYGFTRVLGKAQRVPWQVGVGIYLLGSLVLARMLGI